ncbi:M23 family metallopeptidase [Paenibacillus methanolicus]|uniref:Peptidase M23-like protein n=1 Tax=Paenibacillus methanolicus TaxID=582686 RepID=A0A5S5BK23_9BACL|nr:M23 family metallopeptidase [Paenibacillus methanolicus]TYP67385.1 peptidase M23-like protein [Paenibacillus methanolicus]
MIINIRPRISSAYGAIDSAHTAPHTGVDVAIPEGTELHAVADSVVSRIVEGADRLGNGVILHTPDGHDVIYGHLSRITVRPGQHLQAGDIIGLSGNTGHSTGPHLHLGLMEDGHYIDPTPLVDAALGTAPLAAAKGHGGPLGGLQDALEGFNNTMSAIGHFFKEAAYWLNPANLWRELGDVFQSGSLDEPLMISTIILILILMGGARWPKKWIAWGWVVFWILRGIVFD